MRVFCCMVLGCTRDGMHYEPVATVYDGSCEFNSCGGCMNPLACDFEATATIQTMFRLHHVSDVDESANNHDPNATVSGWCWHEG